MTGKAARWRAARLAERHSVARAGPCRHTRRRRTPHAGGSGSLGCTGWTGYARTTPDSRVRAGKNLFASAAQGARWAQQGGATGTALWGRRHERAVEVGVSASAGRRPSRLASHHDWHYPRTDSVVETARLLHRSSKRVKHRFEGPAPARNSEVPGRKARMRAAGPCRIFAAERRAESRKRARCAAKAKPQQISAR